MKKNKLIPILCTSLMLVGCNNKPTPEPEPEVYPKIMFETDSKVNFMLCKQFKIEKSETTSSIVKSLYSTVKYEEGGKTYLKTNEKLSDKLFIVAEIDGQEMVKDLCVTINDVKYSDFTVNSYLLTNYYYKEFNVADLKITADTKIDRTFTVADGQYLVEYKGINVSDDGKSSDNFTKLKAKAILNGTVLNNNGNEVFPALQLDNVLTKKCETKDDKKYLNIETKKGLCIFLFYDPTDEPGIFSANLRGPKISNYTDVFFTQTRYRADDKIEGAPSTYHTLYFASPYGVNEQFGLDFDYEYEDISGKKHTYKIEEQNFKSISEKDFTLTAKGKDLSGGTEKDATVTIEATPTIKIQKSGEGLEVGTFSDLSIKNITDDNVEKLILSYNKTDFDTEKYKVDTTNFKRAKFNDIDSSVDPATRFEVTDNEVNIIIKDLTKGGESNVPGLLPFEDYNCSKDGYNYTQEKPMRLEIFLSQKK